MQFSHSRVECFEKCPYKYKLRYIDKLKTIKAYEANNALVLGTALHKGLENGTDAAITQYISEFPIMTDDHINEIIKLENLIPLAREIVPDGEKEIKILTSDFIGFVDLLEPIGRNEFDIWDYKYSNNIQNYKDSPQLHLYKYFYEKMRPDHKIRHIKFLFVPKVNMKQNESESIGEFRKRLLKKLKNAQLTTREVEYKPTMINEFHKKIESINQTSNFIKNKTRLCDWCDYQEYCTKGSDYMILPKNERRKPDGASKRILWIYGQPFCGKTTFANDFPDPLILNTDGNIKFVDAPYLRITDKIELDGRMKKRTLAWDILKDTIDELERKENDFKTIVIDLVEDLYDYCRQYEYAQLKITHESDDGFRAWDIVRSEFLNTMRRIVNLDYENIVLISHEDTSKDLTKKGGDKVTAIKPNLGEKVALKLAGMVDIVARVVADGDRRVLSFNSNEVIFGGGRLNVTEREIPLVADEFLKIYPFEGKKATTMEPKTENRRRRAR